jgi:microcystin-dependent protein
MKEYIQPCLAVLLALLLHPALNSQVGVNVLTPHSSAALHVASPAGATKGMLTPSMTTINRISISTGSNTPADGLIVYDVNHRMHYHYQSATFKWVSMSPLLLSTSAAGSANFPFGSITTPPSPGTFSLGINKQNPVCALDVVGNTAITGSVSMGGPLSVTGFPVNALVPAGTIVMWSGNTIPAGWAECNGSSGTPDLRGRFIVAAGQASSTTVPGDLNPNYAPNSKGGENKHALTVAELAKHHQQAVGDGATISAHGGNHAHTAEPRGQGVDAQRMGGNAGGLASDGGATIITSTNSHSHPNGEFAGRVGDGTANGINNEAHENRPQYYVLRFIMKL